MIGFSSEHPSNLAQLSMPSRLQRIKILVLLNAPPLFEGEEDSNVIFGHFIFWVVVSNIFYFHPYLGKWSNLTNISQGWNHQLVLEWPRVKKSRVIVGQTPDGRGMDQYHFACLGTSLLRSLAKILGTVWCFFLKTAEPPKKNNNT